MVTLLKEQNDKITAKSFDELISKLEKHGYDCKNCYEGDDYLRLKKDGDTYQAEYYKKDNGSYELYLGNIHPSKRTKKESYIKEASSVHKELYSDLLDYAEKHRMTSRWTESNVKKYLNRLKKMYDVNDSVFQATLKKVNADYKKKNKVKSDPYSDSSYKKESLVRENNAYPNDWTADTDIHQVFSTLDQSDTKNPGAIEDLYGFDMYNVGWVDGDEDIIKIYAEMTNSNGTVSEKFYVYPYYQRNTYRIETDELGERTVGNAADVWDIMSTCLSKKLKGSYKESLITEKNWSITVPSSLSKAFREELDAVDDWDDEETQTEHIQKAMGALINICKFINNRLPDVDFFEDAESEINNLLDNIYNYEEYDMDFDEAKGEIDYFLNDFWEECDANNIFVQV